MIILHKSVNFNAAFESIIYCNSLKWSFCAVKIGIILFRTCFIHKCKIFVMEKPVLNFTNHKLNLEKGFFYLKSPVFIPGSILFSSVATAKLIKKKTQTFGIVNMKFNISLLKSYNLCFVLKNKI